MAEDHRAAESRAGIAPQQGLEQAFLIADSAQLLGLIPAGQGPQPGSGTAAEETG